MIKSVRKNKRIQSISYAVILLFIVSQSLATNFECKMDMADHDMPTTQSIDSNDPHAGHNMQSMGYSMEMGSTLDSEMIDCCDLNCQCAQNTCSSSNSMITHVIDAEFDGNQHASFFDESKHIHSLASSALYRPPIIC